jgi:peptidoglycan/xylan/chitin deacetylase (PgdA/CDA1 family)
MSLRAAMILTCVALLAPAAARGGEHWIEAEPTLERVTKLWQEGSLEARREVGHSFVRITTDGKAHPTLAAMTAIEPRVDARRRFVKVLLRVDGLEHLEAIELRLGSDSLAADWYSFGVPLYGDPEYNFLQDGQWGAITFGFGGARATGRPDRARVDSLGIMVTDKGKGPARVDFGGFALVDEPKEGVVSFTFDDGHAEHLAAARRLAERGWRGTFYVIPQAIGQPSHLGAAQLAEVGRLGDVAAHADPPFTEVPANELPALIRGIQDYLVERGWAGGAQHLAYPLGKQEPRRVRPEVARAFATARIAGSGLETIPPADPHLLRAVNVVDTMTPEQVGAVARRARESREWAILMFHYLPEVAAKPTDYAMADFVRALEEVAKAGVRVAPVTEVWDEMIAPPPQAELARRAAARTLPAAPAR